MAVWWSCAIVALRRAAWAPVLVFVSHIAVILSLDIYNLFPDFDVFMHFVGGVVIAYFFGGCYRTASQFGLLGQPSVAVFPPMILGLTSLAAVVWEFAEFVADHQFGLHTQPGLADTLFDLLMGLLGGSVWVVLNRKAWTTGIAVEPAERGDSSGSANSDQQIVDHFAHDRTVNCVDIITEPR